MAKAKVVAVSHPVNVEGVETAEEFIAYAARVSNPTNQNNKQTANKLVKYLIDHKHWSPLEMVSVTLEIETTRDIARQVLRHRSFSFQEFSQRYADASQLGFVLRETRKQDLKNRQNSVILDESENSLDITWQELQEQILGKVKEAYTWALDSGIAKEQARAILPEGLTMSRLYMAGTLRSWLHYCDLRMANGTQQEHIDIAVLCYKELQKHFPNILNTVEE